MSVRSSEEGRSTLKRLFNEDWYFKEAPLFDEFQLSRAMSEQQQYQPVEIPHDWLIYQTNDLYRQSEGWYRKHFMIAKRQHKNFVLEFDGIHMNTEIYLNDTLVFEWKYGYTPQIVNISDYLVDGENILFVRVKQEGANSRWYTGAGIFRNIWLHELGEVYVAPDDYYIHQERQSMHQWSLTIDTVMTNHSDYNEKVRLEHRLFDANHQVVAFEQQEGAFGHRTTNCATLTIIDPLLWYPDSPKLYRLETQVVVKDQIQTIHQRVGFRIIEIDANDGLKMNGQHIKLQGVCQHHDLGALGSAVNRQAIRRQLLILKEMGVNAIRTAHNPFSKEFYELTDELGFLVQSEFVDMWHHPKNPNDYARFFDEWVETDVAAWIKRDRNYCSIFMWSIGNEIYDTHGRQDGLETTNYLMALVKKYDYRRNALLTFGSNYLLWENTQKAAAMLEAVGYNYTESKYDAHHETYPNWVIYGSETASVAQSRGVYHFPLSQITLSDDDHQCSSLGNSRTSWGAESIEACILGERDCSFSLGQFLWSGFDYIGEPTPYASKNSYLGQIDTAGFPKDAFYTIKAGWTSYKKQPMIHVFPYWDFSPGQLIDVCVTTNCPSLELFFNGKSMGKEAHDPVHGQKLVYTWQIPYGPGELKAIGYDEQGRVIAQDVESSFGDVVEIRQQPDKMILAADGQDLVFIEVNGLDSEGNSVKNANNQVSVSVSGEGRLVGIDNGDSTDYAEFKGNSKRLFHGKLLLIIASTQQAGDIQITIESDGLPDNQLTLFSNKVNIPNGTAKPISAEIYSKTASIIPIRKIELVKEVTADGTVLVKANTYPGNAPKQPLFWRLTDVKGIDTDIGLMEESVGQVTITPQANGLAYVRCGVKNGKEHIDLYGQIEMTFSGLKEMRLDPYQAISAGRYSRSNVVLTNGNERGVATLRDGESWVIFDKVDFGETQANQLTLSLFPLESNPFEIEIWQGTPDSSDGHQIDVVTYDKGSIWNTYQAARYSLAHALTGLRTITFVFKQKVHFKEFFFEKNVRSFETISIVNNDGIYGDSFQVKESTIEHIGNNVTINFKGFEFSQPVKGIRINGRSPETTNSVHLKLVTDTAEKRILLDIAPSSDYHQTEFMFEESLSGAMDVSFIFLPGSNFDFESFMFIAAEK